MDQGAVDAQRGSRAIASAASWLDLLKLADLFEPFVEEGLLAGTRRNPPRLRKMLGTRPLAVASRETRYAHCKARASRPCVQTVTDGVESYGQSEMVATMESGILGPVHPQQERVDPEKSLEWLRNSRGEDWSGHEAR